MMYPGRCSQKSVRTGQFLNEVERWRSKPKRLNMLGRRRGEAPIGDERLMLNARAIGNGGRMRRLLCTTFQSEQGGWSFSASC